MRIRLTFYSDRNIILPVHYNYVLQSFIYKNIIDPNLSEFIHNNAYSYNKRKFKLFVFSKIFHELFDQALNKCLLAQNLYFYL